MNENERQEERRRRTDVDDAVTYAHRTTTAVVKRILSLASLPVSRSLERLFSSERERLRFHLLLSLVSGN